MCSKYAETIHRASYGCAVLCRDVLSVSGLTFMFVRSLKEAIYGQVWSALQVSELPSRLNAAVYSLLLNSSVCASVVCMAGWCVVTTAMSLM